MSLNRRTQIRSLNSVPGQEPVRLPEQEMAKPHP